MASLPALDDLKPCPFCGASETVAFAATSSFHSDDCECFEASDDYVCVVCDFNKGGCGASSGHQLKHEQARVLWNARSQSETESPHDITCNYRRRPLFSDGCICKVVNKHEYELLERVFGDATDETIARHRSDMTSPVKTTKAQTDGESV